MKTTFLSILLMTMPMLMYVSCANKLGRNKGFKGGTTLSGVEGWQDDHTYVLVISGQWNRDKYYVEGDANADTDGKTAKPSIILQQNAKRAAKEQAKRDFLENVVGSLVEAQMGTRDGELVEDIIRSEVTGTVPSPMAVKENYTASHDVRVTFKFESKGLKKRITDAVNKMIAEQTQSTPRAP